LFLAIAIIQNLLFSQRIKDIGYFKGDASEQVIGYGLVIGLAGTGDSYRSSFTVQSVTSMLKRFGITVQQPNLRTRNVAAVMVTAKITSQLKEGAEFDVTVSSLGDATSLQGGTLLMTPLSGVDGKVYAFAQGPVSIGGYDIQTASGGRIAKNHALAGRVPGGGSLIAPLNFKSKSSSNASVILRQPDFTTANNIAETINRHFRDTIAIALDAAEISIFVPANRRQNIASFLAEVEALQVEKDAVAKVVINERTGTIVAGSNVRILPATISHGNLTITIRSYPIISQPGPFSQGETIVFNNLIPTVEETPGNAIAIEGAATAQEVARALNSLKVSPRDIIAIFQALKEAGALVAELIII
jgi:flagellar P-ring protein precursor FlgI